MTRRRKNKGARRPTPRTRTKRRVAGGGSGTRRGHGHGHGHAGSKHVDGAKKKPGRGTTPPPEYMPDDLDLTERQEKEVQENMTTWLAVLSSRDKSLAYALGHQFEDFIIRCTMKNSNCSSPM